MDPVDTGETGRVGGTGDSRGDSDLPDSTDAERVPDDTVAPVAPDAPEVGPDASAGAPDSEAVTGRDPLRFNSWMKRSATGAVMTGIAVGLQQALELPRQEPAFVIEASGEPDDPNRPIDLHFDPDSPADSVAIVRRPPPKAPPDESSASS